MRNVPIQILSAVDTATITGAAIFSGQYISASFNAIFGDATAAGTIKIQASNESPVGDPKSYTPSATSWSDVPNATSTIASGAGPMIPTQNITFQYIRAVYTRTSGGSTTFVVNATFLSV